MHSRSFSHGALCGIRHSSQANRASLAHTSLLQYGDTAGYFVSLLYLEQIYLQVTPQVNVLEMPALVITGLDEDSCTTGAASS
jgi:hypothetical protein